MASEEEYTTVSTRIRKSTKREWEDYLYKSDAENLSHLVRLAVRNEIEGRESTRPAVSESKLDDIHASVREMVNKYHSIDSRLSLLEREIESDNLLPVQRAAYDSLEVAPEQLEDKLGVFYVTKDPHKELLKTAEDISEEIAHPESVVRQVLDNMAETTGNVGKYTIRRDELEDDFKDRIDEDEVTVYWRKE